MVAVVVVVEDDEPPLPTSVGVASDGGAGVPFPPSSCVGVAPGCCPSSFCEKSLNHVAPRGIVVPNGFVAMML